jgi:hypothetical protein
MSPRRALTFLLCLTALALAGCGGGKSYSFPDVRIDATVNQDGSLSIVEHRTFDFHGQFSFAYFTVEHKAFSDVVDFEISEGGTDYVPDGVQAAGHALLEEQVLEGPGGFKYKATWWFDAEDERRTFTIRYRVLCATDVYADTAHLLWKFIGEGWTVDTDRAVVTIHLPGRVEQASTVGEPLERPSAPCNPITIRAEGVPPVPDLPTRPLAEADTRAWGHGPIFGEVVRVDPQTIELRAEDFPGGTFVEGSVAFPVEAVPLVYRSPEQRLATILAEEGAAADAANGLRVEARASERRHRIARGFGWGFLIGLPLLTALMVVVTRLRERAPGVPRILTEPPEPAIRPARLAIEWSMYRRNVDTPNAFRAQILHLASERAIEIRPIGTVSEARDFELIVRKTPADDLDAKFVGALFPEGKPLRTDEIKPTPKQIDKLGDWWQAILKAARGGGIHLRKSMILLVILVLTSPFWSIPLTIVSELPGWYPWAVIGVTLACPLVARKLLPVRYPPERAGRMQRWAAFRRFLKGFSSLPDAPAAAVVVWEHYLALATALGVADRVEEQVRALVPPQQLRTPWGATGVQVPGPALNGFFGSLSDRSLTRTSVFVHAMASGGSTSRISSSSFSSSSGFSGGGFSGGGGGGGGGTGGGAG